MQSGNYLRVHELNGTLSFIMNQSGLNEERVVRNVFSADFLEELETYYTPTVSLLGLLLNSISVAVLLTSELQKAAVCHYLAASGVVDNIYLLTMMIPWTLDYGIQLYTTKGICQLVLYLIHFSNFLANWYMMLTVVQRASHVFPSDKKRKLESVFQAKCLIVMLAIFTGVGFLHVTWTSGAIDIEYHRICMVLPENAIYIRELRKAELFFAFIVPWVTMVSLLSILAARKCKRCFFESKLPGSDAGDRTFAKRNSVKTTTVTNPELDGELQTPCLVLALVFLAVTLPIIVIRTMVLFRSSHDNVAPAENLMLKLFEQVYLFNFGYKFFVYLTLLQGFREAVSKAIERVLTCKFSNPEIVGV